MLGRKLGNLVGRDIQIEEKVQQLVLHKKNNANHFFFEEINQGPTVSSPLTPETKALEEQESPFDEEELKVANDEDEGLEQPYPLGNDINEIFD